MTPIAQGPHWAQTVFALMPLVVLAAWTGAMWLRGRSRDRDAVDNLSDAD